jgi:hypothetical protein
METRNTSPSQSFAKSRGAERLHSGLGTCRSNRIPCKATSLELRRICPSSPHRSTSLLEHPAAMASPAALGSRALRATQHPLRAAASTRRGLAAAASGSFQYETGDAGGVKFASRDLPGATTTLTVVSKAGTRYQPAPGFTDALEKFAFKVRLSDGQGWVR